MRFGSYAKAQAAAQGVGLGACPPSAGPARGAGIIADIARGVAEALGISELVAHLRSVNNLIPEVAQLDFLNFEATINGSGVVTAQPAPAKVPSNYRFEVMGICGYIESPGDAVANFPKITFNQLQKGKKNVFGTDFPMAQLLTIVGPAPPIMWPRSLYTFTPGADIQATFAVDNTTWNGGAKLVGFNLIGGLIADNEKR